MNKMVPINILLLESKNASELNWNIENFDLRTASMFQLLGHSPNILRNKVTLYIFVIKNRKLFYSFTLKFSELIIS